MTWHRIVFRNSMRTAPRYFGYLSVASLAVLVYFMFSCFDANPVVKQGYMPGAARSIIIFCQYLIAVFAAFFVVFFHSALLRLRSKEFGLFSVLGVTSAQIRSSVFMESIGFGVFSILLGGVLGGLLTKLFLMAIAAIIQLTQPIPFVIPAEAVTNTLVIFGTIFLVDGVVSAILVGRATPKHLLLAGRTKQKLPKFSPVWVAVGLVCIGVSYWLSVSIGNRATVPMFFPIVTLVTIGTYLLFSQAAVFLVQTIRRRSLSGTSILVIGRLAHRLKDNARVLTVVTVLSSAVLSAMGAVLGFKTIITNQARPTYDLLIFAGFFVSLLFFLACGSAIYFRLQAQREDDSRQFQSLKRLGMQTREMKVVVSFELAMLFIMPILVAIVHSIFAIVNFTNRIASHGVTGNVWPIFWSVTGLYVACMLVYYIAARKFHARAVIK
jgi:ABC-type antimicrobial peptide transport system permease subunit